MTEHLGQSGESHRLGQGRGIAVWAKQGGWEWNAWIDTNIRIGAARTQGRAVRAANRALLELQSPQRKDEPCAL